MGFNWQFLTNTCNLKSSNTMSGGPKGDGSNPTTQFCSKNPPPPPPPPALPPLTGSQDLGCWNDSWSRALENNPASAPTIDACRRVAIAKGYKYFAMQNGNVCFAGNSDYSAQGKASGT
jgi:hypothetical protein